MGRKVAASLDIFRQTATSADELDNVDEPSIPLVASTSRRVSTKHPKSTAEPEFSFFKRSEWPDRENVAARREQSDGTRDRVRTRGLSYSTSVSRGASDDQRRKDRSNPVRENVIGDLVNWRTNAFGHSFQDRGRPRERPLASNQPIDPVDHHQPFHRNESSSFRHPRDFQYSPSSSPLSPTDLVLTSPIVPPAIIADSPLPRQDALPPPKVSNSPYTTEDEDDESSNWEDETASDSGTTVSTNSPWPRSPFHSTDSLSPVVKPSVHHDDRDEDDDGGPGLIMRSRVHQPVVSRELSGLPPYLSSFQGVDVQPEEDGPDHRILSRKLANLSQESLPHIPLRPFRNQVGGHSAIYKFTKRAVCKPLVSRENLFYEAVEREAPPLLGFIPRYLGVMLVTYRRVKSNEHSPTSSDDRKARPVIRKANTVPSLESTAAHNSLTPEAPSIIPRIITNQGLSVVEDDGGDTETELPEVALDRNTHIIPHWLLQYNQADRRRHRAASMSHSNLSSDMRPYLSSAIGPGAIVRRKLGDATLSTPDLATETGFCPRPSPLSKHATLPSVAPTPDNSPKILGRFLTASGELVYQTTSAPPMTPDGANLLGPKPTCGFGGTGSTVVNTKLKDHIFSAILRKAARQHRPSAGSSRQASRTPESIVMSDSGSLERPTPIWKRRRRGVVEEGDVADTEGESSRSPRKRSAITTKGLPAIHDTRSRDRSVEEYGMTRRVRIEDMTVDAEKVKMVGGLGKSIDLPCPEHGDVFHMDLDSAEEDVHSKQTLGSSFLPLARKRTRSRSLGPGPQVSVPPSLPSLAIPRGRSDSMTPVPPSNEIPAHPVSAPAIVESPMTSTASSSPRQNHFILMEDLTGRLKKPCVLDLKMGTRQYGMDATPGKKKSQRKKCDRTTSRSLGVRVCGMQVWNNATQDYVTQNKYSGREIKTDDFASVLASFLHDGERLLVHQIPILLSKIYSLAKIVNRLKGYRFYGCSVLLIYDGDREVQDVLISQTHEQPCSRKRRGESLERRRNHQKYPSGSSKSSASTVKARRPSNAGGEKAARDPPSASPPPIPLRRSHSEDFMVGSAAKGCHNSRPRKRGEVNLRIVDFAHTTTGQDWLPYPDPSMDKYSPEHFNAQHPKVEEVSSGKGYVADIDPATGRIYARFPPHYPDQPDRGFLWGLRNVAETLESLWDQERMRRMKGPVATPGSMVSVHSSSSSAFDNEQLPPLSTDGKEIFAEIFGEDGENIGYISS